jgi:SAM-dependent methyltransferase
MASSDTKIIIVAPASLRGLPIPWWSKLLGKLILSRLPVNYRTWRRLGLFRHGNLDDDIIRLIKGWRSFADLFRELTGRTPQRIVEIGPGDSLGHALCAAADGAQSIDLIDVGDFATQENGHYRRIADELARRHGFSPQMNAFDRENVLRQCRARYLTHGLASFGEVATGSIDLIFSSSVLEHLPYGQFDDFLREMFRTLAADGLAIHRVDLQDHIGGRLENLRFPLWLWELPAMARSGFYTNRLRHSDIVSRARACGFDVSTTLLKRWSEMPTPLYALHEDFRKHAEEDLLVCGFTMVLRKRPAPLH